VSSAARPELPEKLYFKIGEVAKIVGVKPYVLRYWETEFSIVRPGKSRSQHRLYRRRDVELLLEIRRLLYDERFTIEGAKKHLKVAGKTQEKKKQLALPLGERTYREALLKLKREVESLYKLLARE